MEFCEERRRDERRQIEKRLRQTKIECCILGIVTFFLASILALQVMHRNNQRAVSASDHARLQSGGDRTAKLQSAGEGETAGMELRDLLVLVNKDHAVPEGYQVQLHWLENRECAVAEEMYDALRDMLTEGSDEGLEFVVASGYRSGEYQQQLLEEDIQASMESEGLTWQQAYDKETRETMPPGYSEHETGLAVDIVSLDYQILDRQQEMTRENEWLRRNCARYGFILRYPQGAEDITGISYEPWHFRYVGKEAAEDITRQGITLEEYLGAE